MKPYETGQRPCSSRRFRVLYPHVITPFNQVIALDAGDRPRNDGGTIRMSRMIAIDSEAWARRLGVSGALVYIATLDGRLVALQCEKRAARLVTRFTGPGEGHTVSIDRLRPRRRRGKEHANDDSRADSDHHGIPLGACLRNKNVLLEQDAKSSWKTAHDD
jgi:hypothetical protein